MRAFDLKSFAYSTNYLEYTQAAQEAEFKKLYARVLDTVPDLGNPDFRTIVALIQGWYGGPDLLRTTQDVNFVPNVTSPTEPDSWQTQPQLYRNAVIYCRSCHSTRKPSQFDWGTYSQFFARRGLIGQRVCNDRIMPNAVRTWSNFWTSAGPDAPLFPPHAPFLVRETLGIVCNPPAP